MLLQLSKDVWISMAELTFLQRLFVKRESPGSGDPSIVLDLYKGCRYTFIVGKKYDVHAVALKMAKSIEKFMSRAHEPLQYAHHSDVLACDDHNLTTVYEDPDANEQPPDSGFTERPERRFGCPVQ